MALTLAGPRLWVLIKAFYSWMYTIFETYRHRLTIRRADSNIPTFSLSSVGNHQSSAPPLLGSSVASQRSHVISHSLIVTKNSHSELGAARDLLSDTMSQLRAPPIELPTNSTLQTDHGLKGLGIYRRCLKPILQLWGNFLKQPVDIVIPLLLSVFFIGIFVAESSGSVLSAGIVSDTTALASSPRCFGPRNGTDISTRALAYSKQCYNTPNEAEDCNYFYNQSISYTEESMEDCPWRGRTCALRQHVALSLDTGYVHSKYVGINAPEQYRFRRRAICAPLVPDGIFINETGKRTQFFRLGDMSHYEMSGFDISRFVRPS